VADQPIQEVVGASAPATYQDLVAQLIGETDTRRLIRDRRVDITVDGTAYTITSSGGIRGYCISANVGYQIYPHRTGSDLEHGLSYLYPKLALLVTCSDEFHDTAGEGW
jgi:hypothetical protein